MPIAVEGVPREIDRGQFCIGDFDSVRIFVLIQLGVDGEASAGCRGRDELHDSRYHGPHYHAGWFRVANGRTVRLYRAEGMRVVLLPARANGAPVLL